MQLIMAITNYLFSQKPGQYVSKTGNLLPVMGLLVIACRQPNALFTPLSSSHTGISFNNRLVEDEELNVLNYTYFYNGGGVAAADLNNDGLPDLVFTGNMVKNRLYLNKGNLKFEDITDQSGIAALQGWCTGVTLADVNADGWLDIYICRSADVEPERRKNLLYLNNKNNTFTEAAQRYGIADDGYSTQAAFFDYDRDDDLDLVVINHSLQQYTTGAQENPSLRTQKNKNYATRLYRNEGNHFTNVTDSAGIISNVLSFGLGIAITDVNNDGWPDMYLSNDFSEQDYCFINNRNGTFAEQSHTLFTQQSLYSMGNEAADLNNDGLTDIITLDMLPESNYLQKMHSGAENFDKFQTLFANGFSPQYSRNMLQLNNGNGTFSEVGQWAGISNTDWSWAALAQDFDNDGHKDIFITNGYVKDYTDMDFLKYSADKATQGAANQKAMMADILQKMPTIKLANYAFKNNGQAAFTNTTQAWGLQEPGISAGAAYADLDNDGDLDLVVNNSNAEASLYRNNSQQNPANRYLQIKLKGSPGNPWAVGAKVTLHSSAKAGGKLQMQELNPTRGFQSSSDYTLHFGFDSTFIPESVTVHWPDGKVSNYRQHAGIMANTLMLEYATAQWDTTHRPQEITQWFGTAQPLPFTHIENPYNDFSVQGLLPEYYSRQGPALAVADVNGDGQKDIFTGGAMGQPGALLLGKTGGGFTPLPCAALLADSAFEDITAAFFDANADGHPDLLVGSGGYEVSNPSLLQNRLYLGNGKGGFTRLMDALPPDAINDRALAIIDANADGYPDIFNGGHCKPGAFPQSSGYQLLLNNGQGKFSQAPHLWLQALPNNLLLTSAAVADFNADGKPDLALAGHWVEPLVLENTGNSFIKSTIAMPPHLTGLYNTLLATDVNADGTTDLVLGNQGLNNQFQATAAQPLELFYADFDGNGIAEPLMSYYIGGQPWPANSRDDLMAQIPAYNKKFLFYADYAKATLANIVGPEKLANARAMKVENLASVALLNSGTGFNLNPLPAMAQWAPIYALAALPGSTKGAPHLVAAGNQSYTRIKYGRYNASYGLLLQNNTGKPGTLFNAVSPMQSGLLIKGDCRQLAVTEQALLAAINNQTLLYIPHLAKSSK